MVSATRYVGEPVRRREDLRMLTGKGRYIDDVKAPGMLYAAFVRSPYPNARVTKIDVGPALECPGVVAAIVSEDLVPAGNPDVIQGTDGGLYPPLASGHVAFVGDPVVIVCAESRAEAEDGCEQVFVDYEALPAAVTIDDSLAGPAAPVHPGTPNLVGTTHAAGSDDLDEAFRVASWVVEENIVQHRYVACPMETQRGDGELASVSAPHDHLHLDARRPRGARPLRRPAEAASARACACSSGMWGERLVRKYRWAARKARWSWPLAWSTGRSSGSRTAGRI